jgi:anti-anti-sigma factor
MAFHFCAHSWEVRDLEDGTVVTISNRDLDRETIAVLVDELLELVMESGQANLYLDFERIGLISSVVIAKMLLLDTKLREHGGRLILLNVNPSNYRLFQAARLTDALDIRTLVTA